MRKHNYKCKKGNTYTQILNYTKIEPFWYFAMIIKSIFITIHTAACKFQFKTSRRSYNTRSPRTQCTTWYFLNIYKRLLVLFVHLQETTTVYFIVQPASGALMKADHSQQSSLLWSTFHSICCSVCVCVRVCVYSMRVHVNESRAYIFE